jgi:hypothetical protein
VRVQFVDDGVDFSFEVDLSDLAREQISLQTHLGSDDRFRERFASLLRESLPRMLRTSVDRGLGPPDGSQLLYGVEVARTLNIGIPREALRYRDGMKLFLNEHAPRYNEIRRVRRKDQI